MTEGLVLDGNRCTGVRYSIAGEVREARAGRAVVVSAGAFNSPQLMELSGIGQPERLRNLGIEVRHELPGVGENLRDHYVPRTRWLVGKRASPSTIGGAALAWRTRCCATRCSGRACWR